MISLPARVQLIQRFGRTLKAQMERRFGTGNLLELARNDLESVYTSGRPSSWRELKSLRALTCRHETPPQFPFFAIFVEIQETGILTVVKRILRKARSGEMTALDGIVVPQIGLRELIVAQADEVAGCWYVSAALFARQTGKASVYRMRGPVSVGQHSRVPTPTPTQT